MVGVCVRIGPSEGGCDVQRETCVESTTLARTAWRVVMGRPTEADGVDRE